MTTARSMTPPSTPMLMMPSRPEPDDIPDPPVPPGTVDADTAEKAPSSLQEPRDTATAPETLEPTVPAIPASLVPLAHGFCQYVQGLLTTQLEDAGIKMARVVEQTTNEMATFTKGVLASNEHASYQLSDALSKVLEQGVPLLSPPYQAVLQVTTPRGYPLTLTVTKSTSAALIEELGRVEGWLHTNGYTPAFTAIERREEG